MIRSSAPKVGVILVTCLDPDHLQEKAKDAGALASLHMDQLRQFIFEAVDSVHRGHPAPGGGTTAASTQAGPLPKVSFIDNPHIMV